MQEIENARLLGGKPQGAGQAQIAEGGRQRQGSGAILDKGGHLLGAAQVGLMNDARLAFDAAAFDEVVVELVGLFLGDERCHIG